MAKERGGRGRRRGGGGEEGWGEEEEEVEVGAAAVLANSGKSGVRFMMQIFEELSPK